jgi:gliding motility-associated-like protein
MRLIFLLVALWLPSAVVAQTYLFAELKGSPNMNIQGWNLVGDARVGDTDGDPNFDSDELILCNPINNTNGACFFRQPVNVSECQKWAAEFEYRIFDGNAADGIAFCFLANPPTGYIRGGGIGIPTQPLGLMVVVDTWLNCPGTTAVPKLEIRYGDGNINYSECPQPAQPTSATIPELRSPNYNKLRITYDRGNINVFFNDRLALSGFYRISFSGYFGLTASTGGFNDRHSVRNFSLYTYKPIVSPPNAGGDRTICSGQTVSLGVEPQAGDPYKYSWLPRTGLDNPNIANPKLTLTNTSRLPQRYTYFVTKDSLLNDTLCAYSDAVEVVVMPKGAYAGEDVRVCSGESRRIGAQAVEGYRYTWSPATGLDVPTSANPSVRLTNNTNTPQTFTYVVTSFHPTFRCSDTDTVKVTVMPSRVNAGADLRLCANERRTIGTAQQPEVTYQWTPTNGLSNPNIANPTVSLPNTTADSLTVRYILTATQNGCLARDTVQVVVLPPLKADAGADQNLCPNGKVIIGSKAIAGATYTWSPSEGLSDPKVAAPEVFFPLKSYTAGTKTYILTVKKGNCTATDTVKVQLLPLPITEVAKNVLICSGDSVRIGGKAVAGATYRWQPTAGLSDSTLANPWLKLNAATQNRYIVTSRLNGCVTADTIQVTVNQTFSKPTLYGTASVCPNTAGVSYSVRNADARALYRWTVKGGTIVSGQNTDSVRVNWGSASEAWIKAEVSNALGCSKGADSLAVTIFPLLKPQLPESPLQSDTLCLNDAQNVRYEVPLANGSVYTWGVSAGGEILSGQGSARIQVRWKSVGVGRVWISEAAGNGRCFGRSDTLQVLIAPMPNIPVISGATQVCESQQTWLYHTKGFALSRFKWAITGGEIVKTQTDSVWVRWPKAATGSLSVVETSALGCMGSEAKLPIVVNPLPQTRRLSSDSVICVRLEQPLTYRVSASERAIYQWKVEGGKIVSGDSTAQVSILWDKQTFPKRLSVVEQSAAGCQGAPVTFSLYTDRTQILIRSVSIEKQNIALRFRITGTPNLPRNFVVSRRVRGQTDWTNMRTVTATDTLLIDNNLSVSNTIYEYRIATADNTCAAETVVHNSLVLSVKGNEAESSLALDWNAYQGWPQVDRYEIWRKTDDLDQFTLYKTVSGSWLQYSDFSAAEAFRHCFKIKAVGSGESAWSNEMCVDFTHQLTAPNVITPNGDGKNDRFVIPKLPLYPRHRFRLFDRWGKEVYATDTYANDWAATDRPSGVYFWVLEVQGIPDSQVPPRRETFQLKGWLQILRDE